MENCLGLERQEIPPSRRFVEETRARIYVHATNSGAQTQEMEAWVVLFSDTLVIKGIHASNPSSSSSLYRSFVKKTLQWIRRWRLFGQCLAVSRSPSSSVSSPALSPHRTAAARVVHKNRCLVIELDLRQCHAIPSVTIHNGIFLHDSAFTTMLTIVFVNQFERDSWLQAITQQETVDLTQNMNVMEE